MSDPAPQGPRLKTRRNHDDPAETAAGHAAVPPEVRAHQVQANGRKPKRTSRMVDEVSPEVYVPPPPLTREEAGRPDLPESPPYLFCVSAEEWHVMGDQLVPVVSRLPLHPGLAGVVTTDEKIDPRAAIAKAASKFRLVVPWDIDKRPEHGGFNTYLRKVSRGKGRAPFWGDRFSYPDQSGTPAMEAAWAEWALSLVDRIPGMGPCPSWVIQRLIEGQVSLLGRVRQRGPSVDRDEAIERITHDLGVLRTALAEAEVREGPAAGTDENPDLVADAE